MMMGYTCLIKRTTIIIYHRVCFSELSLVQFLHLILKISQELVDSLFIMSSSTSGHLSHGPQFFSLTLLFIYRLQAYITFFTFILPVDLGSNYTFVCVQQKRWEMEKLKNTFVCNMAMWVGYSNCVEFKADQKLYHSFFDWLSQMLQNSEHHINLKVGSVCNMVLWELQL